jgi:hypothetical protein
VAGDAVKTRREYRAAKLARGCDRCHGARLFGLSDAVISRSLEWHHRDRDSKTWTGAGHVHPGRPRPFQGCAAYHEFLWRIGDPEITEGCDLLCALCHRQAEDEAGNPTTARRVA